MKRSVRNGIAVLGMAGGMWFLGHAVANADTAPVNQDATATGSGAIAANVNANVVSSNVDSSATNVAVYNSTGDVTVRCNGNDSCGDVTAKSGSVTIEQSATSTVSNSGNIANATGPVNQQATATVPPAPPKKEWDGNSGDNQLAFTNNNMGGDEHGGPAVALNVNINKVTSNVDSSAKNVAVDNYTGNVTVRCNGRDSCGDVNAQSGDLTIKQSATSTISNSGNIGNNAPVPGQQPCTCPEQKKAVVAAAAKKVTPATKAVVLSSAQPTAVLATTGAEYGVPLTLGLIALGAGAGLTVAGRRRRYSTTV